MTDRQTDRQTDRHWTQVCEATNIPNVQGRTCVFTRQAMYV